MMDAVVERWERVAELSTEVAEAYERQAGWDARAVANNLVLYLKPTRVQAWREGNEIEGRTLMRNGVWLA